MNALKNSWKLTRGRVLELVFIDLCSAVMSFIPMVNWVTGPFSVMALSCYYVSLKKNANQTPPEPEAAGAQ